MRVRHVANAGEPFAAVAGTIYSAVPASGVWGTHVCGTTLGSVTRPCCAARFLDEAILLPAHPTGRPEGDRKHEH